MESMQAKINTINIVQGSKSSKTMIRSKFTEMNCILINVPDPLLNPLIYISYCYHE